jgi:phosphopantothenoylcysteine synthetase/decarboxylase
LKGFGSINNQKSSINTMKIALGVTGGIAAYKAAEIVRLLQDRGIRVQVIMTRAAQEFVKPLRRALRRKSNHWHVLARRGARA